MQVMNSGAFLLGSELPQAFPMILQVNIILRPGRENAGVSNLLAYDLPLHGFNATQQFQAICILDMLLI